MCELYSESSKVGFVFIILKLVEFMGRLNVTRIWLVKFAMIKTITGKFCSYGYSISFALLDTENSFFSL